MLISSGNLILQCSPGLPTTDDLCFSRICTLFILLSPVTYFHQISVNNIHIPLLIHLEYFVSKFVNRLHKDAREKVIELKKMVGVKAITRHPEAHSQV